MSMTALLPNKDNYDEISDIVRRFCTERLYELEKTLRPYIDGSFGEVSPPHTNSYIVLLRELARLYEAHKRPKQDDSIPTRQVEAMLEQLRQEADARMQAAVVEAEQRVRAELQAASTKSIESAKQAALTKLTELQNRRGDAQPTPVSRNGGNGGNARDA
jgi:hypothetical protein